MRWELGGEGVRICTWEVSWNIWLCELWNMVPPSEMNTGSSPNWGVSSSEEMCCWSVCGELTWQVWEWLNAVCSQLWVLRRGPCPRVLFLANPGFVLTWLSLSVLLRIKNYAWIKMRVQMVLSGPLCKRDYNNVLKSLWSGFKIEEGELHRWSAMVTFHLPEYRWNKGMLVKVIWIALEPYSMIWFKDHKRRILLEARPQKRTGDEELSCSQLWDGRAAAAGPGPPGPPIPVGGRKHGGQWEGRTLGPCSAPVFDEEENLLEQERREGAEAFPRCQ